MDTSEYIKSLQDYAINILKEGNPDKPLWMLAKYNCSEMSWLLGLKVVANLGEESNPFTLKGDVNNGMEKVENIHDILGYYVKSTDNYVVVDPTIWQFYPEVKSIFVGRFKTIKEMILGVSKFYEGDWGMSYKISEIHEDEMENRKIIRMNCDQAPKWED